MNTIWRS